MHAESFVGVGALGFAMSPSEQDFQERLERAKLDAMKELAYGASHEINNPLANISARAQTLLRDERVPDRRRALEAINQQALRAHEMISDLMLFARPPRLELQLIDVLTVVGKVVGEAAAECDRRGIDLSLNVDDGLPRVRVDVVQLAAAVTAVLMNAIDATGPQGRVALQLGALITTPDQVAPVGVRLSIRDDGPGIPPEVRPHVFDPFFSGREAGRGLGFGLSKAWRIVTGHGGAIRVSSTDGAGAEFIIELPVGPE
jgi:signal transduction histidine kinase